jgi:hypothetical protein
MIYCAPFTALTALAIPYEPTPKVYNIDIEAAAQWVVWPLECRYLYVECLKKDTTAHYWEPWSKQRWAAWKQSIEVAAVNVLHSDCTRNLANLAFQKMTEVELEIDEMGFEGSGSHPSDSSCTLGTYHPVVKYIVNLDLHNPSNNTCRIVSHESRSKQAGRVAELHHHGIVAIWQTHAVKDKTCTCKMVSIVTAIFHRLRRGYPSTEDCFLLYLSRTSEFSISLF